MAEQQQQIARINELSTLARTSWLVLLAFLGYIGITLLSVHDADFFVPSRETELPLVGISIPTFSFFVFAPLLCAALYIYLHIHLLKLFDALACAPARIDGEALGDVIHPWLANDVFLKMRCDSSITERPLSRLSNFASVLLVWVAPPLVLIGFWWRSMPAKEEWLTLFLGINLLIATYAGFSSWLSSQSAAKRTHRRPWPKPWRSVWRRSAGLFFALVIAVLSWLRTEGDFQYYENRLMGLSETTFGITWFDYNECPSGIETPTWIQKLCISPLARTDLAGVELVALPESWRSYETARRVFRESWCRREGLNMAVCGHFPSIERTPPVTLEA
jgi:hypothetical protein